MELPKCMPEVLDEISDEESVLPIIVKVICWTSYNTGRRDHYLSCSGINCSDCMLYEDNYQDNEEDVFNYMCSVLGLKEGK